ncbi:glycoside hydrolase family 10 protein [Sodalis sp. dw_96]|uniref:glycoside hydrolase family 10 protein n=1 Tax=Sodalis sp. dw_96 TaxID=2719794 RepID=UPI002102510A|nr:glycoside hydrolase family 10 protein [Sodalis sp. dw_96]
MPVHKKVLLWPIVILCSWLLAGCSHNKATVKPPAPEVKREQMRGVWLATVSGLDWPARSSLEAATDADRIRMQKKAMTDKLDNLLRTGINTVFFQVKPDGTALYQSSILPWSDVLTGVTGKNPGYDPLAFMLAEAHKRGIRVHAWLNPYRVSMDTRPETMVALDGTLQNKPASVYALHHDWIRKAGDRFVLDPGLPDVRKWITSVVTELIKNYHVDGIQFDDYFYYETPQSQLDDEETYREYGQGFTDKAHWRRNNTLQLVKQISSTIKALRPEVEFGISPAGVWRNVSDDPRGSDTQGGRPAYDTAYADTRQWVELGLLDYIAPQLYWPFARKIVRYDVLARWWSEVVKPTHTRLYIGVALYKIGIPSVTEPDWSTDGGVPELKRQLDLNDALPEVDGTILFREAYLCHPQTEDAVNYLRNRWHAGAEK